jgi:hypothetical protein
MNCEHLKYDLSVEVLTRGRHPLTAAVVTHLEFCPECRQVYEDLQETAELLSLLGQDDHVPGDAPLPVPAQSSCGHPSGRTVTVRRKTRGSASPPDAGPTRCAPAHWQTEPSGPPRAHRP